jgi:uncharacterized protein (DUF433 family)
MFSSEKDVSMEKDLTAQSTVIRTSRGLSIAGTRITLYSIMDYVTAGWPAKLIRDRLNLTDQQITDALAYIAEHRIEVEAEYQQVLRDAEENRRYWEERNRERFAKIAALPPKPEHAAIRAKLHARKAKVDEHDDRAR